MSIKAMNWVWQDVRVEGGLKLILLAIADNADDNGVAWPSLQTIASKAEVSLSTAKRKVKQLETLGLMSVTRRTVGYNNSSNKYRLNVDQKFDLRAVAILEREQHDTGVRVTLVKGGLGEQPTGVNLNPVGEGSEFSHVTPLTRVNLTPVSEVTSVTGDTSLGSPRVSYEPPITTNNTTTATGMADPFAFTSTKTSRKIERFAMHPEWLPSDQVFERLRHRRIDTAFAKNLIDGFRMYWSEREAQHAGAWDSKFLGHVVHNWETGGRERSQQASKATTPITDRITDRSWAETGG